MHRIVLGAAAAAALALSIAPAAPAQAAPDHRAERLSIHTTITAAGDATVIRFTAARPLCASGVQVDGTPDVTVIDQARNIFRIAVDSTSTCDDGSGSFVASQVIIDRFSADGSSVSSGPSRFHGGTGRYRHLLATGVDSGSVGSDQDGAGEVCGVVLRF